MSIYQYIIYTNDGGDFLYNFYIYRNYIEWIDNDLYLSEEDLICVETEILMKVYYEG